VKEGAYYGWPWYYLGANEDPRQKGARPDLKDKVTLPDVYMQAHSAPLQTTFYQGDNFPAEYKGSAFVTLHGSWNRGQRTGYKVVRILFDSAGKPTGEYQDLHDRLRRGRQTGVGAAGRRSGCAGRLAVRHRRWQRHDLARDEPTAGSAVGWQRSPRVALRRRLGDAPRGRDART
jgi:hypothetical protein